MSALMERTLYEFDWQVGDETGSQIGWWTGRVWVAAFGDGMWSPQFVTAYREGTLIVPMRQAAS